MGILCVGKVVLHGWGTGISREFDPLGLEGEAQSVLTASGWEAEDAKLDCQKLKDLPLLYREILIMYYRDEMTSIDIREIFGLSCRKFWAELKKATDMAREALDAT